MKPDATLNAASFAIMAPDGRPIRIPATPAEDGPSFGVRDLAAARDHLASEGYVVVRGLVPPEPIDDALAAFEAEVRPSDRAFMRHASGKLEPHVFTPEGHMLYPIMNPHELTDPAFQGFAHGSLEVLANPRVATAVQALFDGEPGKLTHTMFFDGNQVTWAHHDSFYVDSVEIGAMVGMWVAAEDIHPGAGRFYVYPRSHRLPRLVMGQDFQDPNGDDYKALVLDIIRREALTCRAPALRKGDALFFSSLTIHGSLPTMCPAFARRSFTAHFVPRSHAFWSFHRRRYDLPIRTVNGVEVCFREAA